MVIDRVTTLLRAVARRGRGALSQPKQATSGRIVESSQILDAQRPRMIRGWTFRTLINALDTARMGDVALGLRLFAEIEEVDSTLQCVANTRRLAVTGLDYEIVSAADVRTIEDRTLADEATVYVREQLTRLESFDDALEHMALAIGWNLAVVENVWERNSIVDTVNVPNNRLRIDPTEPDVIRVRTPDDAVGTPAIGHKWVVHTPRSVCGTPLVRSLMWASLTLHFASKLSFLDWCKFTEVFGMPVRWAKYHHRATEHEKSEMLAMLENMGSAGYAIFSEAVELSLIESSQRGTAPYEALLAWIDRAKAKLWLGGNLTTDNTGATGSLAAASVQNEVRADLRDDDIKREGQTVRRQFIGPMVAFVFRRPVPLPYFRRIKPEVIDRVRESELFLKAQQAGVRVPKQHAYKTLGIPEPAVDEETLSPSLDAFGDGLSEGASLVGA